jgi:hypothetical protein
VSALAHYFEDEGLATVIVALVREHIVTMQPPRAIWVPYQLGRPFGAPNDTGLQMRVLRAALALLDSPKPGPLLVDFLEEAPHLQGEPDWTFPGVIDSSSLQAEVQSIQPCWQQIYDCQGGSTVGISGLSPEHAVEYVKAFHSDEPMPNPKGMSRIARARFAIDDIKAYYLEAATAGAGHPSSFQLNEWFWEQTLAGAMIRSFQERARNSEDKNLHLIEDSLVPAERANSLRR